MLPISSLVTEIVLLFVFDVQHLFFYPLYNFKNVLRNNKISKILKKE